MRDCLIIFAKEPELGRVKTRLQGCLSKKKCVELYKVFLQDTLDLARATKCPGRVLAYDSSDREPKYLKKIAKDFLFYKQEGKDLGEKMHRAFKFAARMNYGKKLILGSDSPHLPLSYILEAYKGLDKSDIVLGPSLDGGYYFVGLKKPSGRLFQHIQWSTQTVFQETLRNARKMQRRVSVSSYWYDVDSPDDLIKLERDLKKRKNKNIAPRTREFFKSFRAALR